MTSPRCVVFVDTNAWAAIFLVVAPFHVEALRLVVQSQTQNWDMITSEWVLSELVPLLANTYKRPQAEALAIVKRIRGMSNVTVMDAEPVTSALAWQRLDAEVPHKFSHVDATSFVIMFVIMDALGISEAFTADRHFSIASYARLLTTP